MTDKRKTLRHTLRHAHSDAHESTKLRLFILTLVCVSSLAGTTSLAQSTFAALSVPPVVETDPSPHAGDSADDSVIWIHPTDPSLSLVIGNDKDGGLMVWGLDGKQVQYVDGTLYNNVDLRYNFPLAGSFSNGTSHTHVALVGVGDEDNSEIDFFKVNPVTRRLEPAGSLRTQSLTPYGSCMYHSPLSGKFYYFVNDEDGVVQQLDLSGASGTVTGQMVRTFRLGTQTEGCVADDQLGHLYIGEEAVGIWKFGAEPEAGAARTQVDATGGGRLVADVEGLTIYYNSDGTGYLIASSQGDSTFAVYTREGSNSYLGSFQVGASGTIDSVSGTDGLDVTNFPLGPTFPSGMLVVHDSSNAGAAASNQKFVRWESVADGLSLRVDTSWDPREVGAGTIPPPPPPPGNRQPTANPDSATTTSGFSVTIAVLANDTDPDNHRLIITAATNGGGGSVRLNADSTITYAANATFSGLDTFTYTISDGHGGSATGIVTVTVQQPGPPPPDDPPTEPGSTEFYFPQIADGEVDDDDEEVFRTVIILSNPTGTPATGTIRLKLADVATGHPVSGAIAFRCLDDDRATCALTGDMLDSDAQGVLSFRIAANGQVVLMTAREDSSLAQGYAKVTSDIPVSGMALVVLREEEHESDGSIDIDVEFQAAEQATGKMKKFAVTDFRDDTQTALAVVNLGTEATTLTLRKFAASGTETAGQVPLTLAAGEHRAFFLKDVLSPPSESPFGMVIVESSNAHVTAVALKFDDDEFTIAPVIKME